MSSACNLASKYAALVQNLGDAAGRVAHSKVGKTSNDTMKLHHSTEQGEPILVDALARSACHPWRLAKQLHPCSAVIHENPWQL